MRERERQREELEALMLEEHRRALQSLQERHGAQLRVLEDEKRRLKEEMQKTMEIEREKVRIGQRLEME